MSGILRGSHEKSYHEKTCWGVVATPWCIVAYTQAAWARRFQGSFSWVVRFRSKMPEVMRKLDGGFEYLLFSIRTTVEIIQFLTTAHIFEQNGWEKTTQPQKRQDFFLKHEQWHLPKYRSSSEVRGWAVTIHREKSSALGISGVDVGLSRWIESRLDANEKKVKVNF